MRIEFIGFFLIASPKYAISLIDDFVGLQLLLNVWKVGNIELLFRPPCLILTMGVEWHPLLHLWLQLRWWLVLVVVYVLNYLVCSCCQLVCVYCVVDVRYVLGTVATLRALLVDLKLLLLRWFWLVLRGLCLFVLIELLAHDVCGSRSWDRVLCWRRSGVIALLGLRIKLLVRFLGTHETSVVLALGQRVVQRIHWVHNIRSSLKSSLYTWDVGCRIALRDAIYLLWSQISIILIFHVIKSRVISSCVRSCRMEIQRSNTVFFTSCWSLVSLRLLLNYLFWSVHARIDVRNVIQRFRLLYYCWVLAVLLTAVVYLR